MLPFWFKNQEVDGVMTPIPIKKKVELMKDIFDLYIQGSGTSKIAEKLNKR